MTNAVLSNCQERLVKALESYNEKVKDIHSKYTDERKQTQLTQAQVHFEYLTWLSLSESYNPSTTNPEKYINSFSHVELACYIQPVDYQ